MQTSFSDLKKVWKIHVKIKSGNNYGKKSLGVFFLLLHDFVLSLFYHRVTTAVKNYNVLYKLKEQRVTTVQ